MVSDHVFIYDYVNNIQQPGTFHKLRNILEIYEAYIPLDRRSRYLFEALFSNRCEENKSSSGDASSHVPDKADDDAQTVRVCGLLRTSEGISRAQSRLCRASDGNTSSDDEIVTKIQINLDSGIRTML